jgi:hypothetical protein
VQVAGCDQEVTEEEVEGGEVDQLASRLCEAVEVSQHPRCCCFCSVLLYFADTPRAAAVDRVVGSVCLLVGEKHYAADCDQEVTEEEVEGGEVDQLASRLCEAVEVSHHPRYCCCCLWIVGENFHCYHMLVSSASQHHT